MDNYSKVVDDIKYGRIFSSTLTVFTALDALVAVVRDSKTAAEAVANYSKLAKSIVSARPTSAMLVNSIRELTRRLAEAYSEGGLSYLKDASPRIADSIKRELLEASKRACIIAARRIEDGDVILTSSYSMLVKNAIEYALKEGKSFELYITESRPGGEGLKLAEEVSHMGVKVTLFVDSAVRLLMKNVDKVLISCEAVAANGAVINKVGTSLMALAAHEARVRVFTIAPTHKFSPETMLGELVELSEREPSTLVSEEKLREWGGRVKVEVPLFDVTPPEYVDAIVTENGLIAPQAVIFLIRELYGWPPRVLLLEDELENFEKVVARVP